MGRTVKSVKEILLHLEKFDPAKKNFLDWRNKMEYILHKFNIENECRKAFILLNIINTSIIPVIKAIIKPVNIHHISYEMIISILEEKYSPYGKYDSLKYRLSTRDQFPNESVIDYLFALKNLNDQIIFGTVANSKLLSCFIKGLNSQEIRQKLNTIPDLNASDAVRIAMKMESDKNLSTGIVISEQKKLNLLNELEEEEKGQTSQAATLKKK